ncbi:MAG: DNA mismatch repair endonuclease MutL [Planctomycetes bacterium]|nr:DNA mismatch repair endonuclease MutL [Planctomycetota bacterium]
MPIRLLPPELVNQIAAGEVVERPASVVKELVENALDAGAARVSVELEGGGADLIRVSDDGGGIAPDELLLAVTAHATSKIASFDDLEAVASYGFRGEALASIGSVAQLRITSRRAGDGHAHAIEVDGGLVNGPRPAAGAPGTVVEVRTLFRNVPARRKFLRSQAAETGRVHDAIDSIALGAPGIGFRLSSDGRAILDLPPQDERTRCVQVLGAGLAPELLDLSFEFEAPELHGPIRIGGVVGTPAAAKASARNQWLLINGRPIEDRSLQHAVREAFRGLMDPSVHPVYALFIELDPRGVDMNVHPAKTEVRLRFPSLVHRAIRRAVAQALEHRGLVVQDRVAATDHADPTLPLPLGMPQRTIVHADGGIGMVAPLARPQQVTAAELDPAPSDDARTVAVPAHEPCALDASAPVRFMQVDRSWLVVEEGDGLTVIDQHALHERVMFEDLRARIERSPLERQRLLVPELVDCGTGAIERIEALAPILERLGLECTPAGARTIAVHSMPSFLVERGVGAQDFLVSVAASDLRADDPRAAEAALAEVLDLMACKAAVKAGDRLTTTEIAALLARRATIDRPDRCPHGRPTAFRLTTAELERRFGRA